MKLYAFRQELSGFTAYKSDELVLSRTFDFPYRWVLMKKDDNGTILLDEDKYINDIIARNKLELVENNV